MAIENHGLQYDQFVLPGVEGEHLACSGNWAKIRQRFPSQTLRPRRMLRARESRMKSGYIQTVSA